MNRSSDDLRRAARGGTQAALLAQLAGQITSLVVLGVLCRWIAPSEFGVFNTALLIVTLPRMLATLGLNAATIQRPQLTDAELTALWKMQLGLGVACAVVSAALGPAIGWLVDAPRVGEWCFILSGTSLVAAAGAQHQALLERHLRVQRVVSIRLAAQVLAGGIAVGAALSGAEAWALVLQQYIELGALAVLAWQSESWRPVRRGEPIAWRPLVRFGSDFSLTNLMFYLAQNTDKLVLFVLVGGREAGQAAIGMYSLAFNLMMKPVYVVTTPVSGVMLPALSRAAERRAEFVEMTLGFYRLVGGALLPSGVGLWLVADDVTRLLAGPNWEAAGTLLATLAPAILVQGFINIAGSLLTAAGRTRPMLLGSAVVALVQLQGHVAGCLLGGWFLSEWQPAGEALGLARAYTLVLVFVVALPYLVFAWRQVGIAPTRVLRMLRPALLATSSMGLVVWGTRQLLDAYGPWPTAARLTICVAVGVLVFVAIARREIRAALELVPSGRR